MTRQLTIDYPDTLPQFLQESWEQFEQEAKMAMAVKLFEMKRISSGMAAMLAGLDRVSFLLQLRQYGVSAVNLEDDEVLTDMANA